MQWIKVRGARTHNLKDIQIDLPRDQLIVVTGLSGSGKSSLAFDTLYAEGQRRYVESLSAYARQFLQLMDKPDVDSIEGLSPAIAIEQKATSHNPRSTVGTVTEIHDYLRLLFARVGVPYCPDHHEPLKVQTVSQIVDQIMTMPLGTKIMLLAPVVDGRKGEHVDLFEGLIAQGYTRFRVQSGGGTTKHRPPVIYMADELPELKKNEKHTIEVVVDRVKVAPDVQQRLTESVETALRLGEDRLLVFNMETDEIQLFNARYACSHCGYTIHELEPRLFSFNNPAGACGACDGLGVQTFFDPSKIVAHPELSMASGAIKNWDKRNPYYWQMLLSVANHYNIDLFAPFESLPVQHQTWLLRGSGKEAIAFEYTNERGTVMKRNHPFEGIIPNIERRYRETDSQAIREELAKYQNNQVCPHCGGSRLRKEALYVKVGDGENAKNIHEISVMALDAAYRYFQEIRFQGMQAKIAEKVVQEIRSRLGFLNNVGLDYLSLSRSAETLSGGEAQRIRLASQIGSGLTGVLYVLDEPSIGLHQRDNDRLIQTLKYLKDLKNTVLVVEHDEDMIRQADFVLDLGPGAGIHGGQIMASGTPAEVIDNPHSLTGDYLSGRKAIKIPSKRHVPTDKWIRLTGATGHNLRNVTLEIPIGLMTCVTGVSGSGKSTLINDTLYPLAANALNRANLQPAAYDSIVGLEHLDKVVDVDQSPIGRTPRSNPATYTGVFTPIRELFAQVPMAKERGYTPGRFSFNVKGGRCEVCEGDGVIKVEMHFLPDVYVTCDACKGRRYNRETLDVVYKGKNISDVLAMPVSEAATFFQAIPAISRKLQTLLDVGLGYICLGQSATTLSGGEAQRIKLALELSKRDTGKTLYILDEPTTGLHFADIDLLLKVINRLRDQGNTVVVIEHNLDVIKVADWIVDLGPEGGSKGGTILTAGPPEFVANQPESYTGYYLKILLERNLVKSSKA